MKIHFNKTNVNELPIRSSRYYASDKGSALQVAVMPSGDKVWYVRRRIDGKPTRVRIARVADLELKKARDAAGDIVADISKGVDPVEKRRAECEARAAIPTLREAAQTWKAERDADSQAAGKGDSSWAHRSLNHLGTHLADLADKKLSDITRDHLMALRNRMSDRPTQANRVVQVVYAVMRAAGWPDDKVKALKVPFYKSKVRRRVINGEEFGRLLASLDKADDLTRDFYLVLAFTAQRHGAVRQMEWSQLDLDAGVWHCPARITKSNEDADVPLTEGVLALLRDRQASARNKWVFPRDVGDTSRAAVYCTLHLRWLKVVKDAGLEGVRPHDLRRTFLSNTGDLQTAKSIAGHADIRTTTRHYVVQQLDHIRASMQATELKLRGGFETVEDLEARIAGLEADLDAARAELAARRATPVAA